MVSIHQAATTARQQWDNLRPSPGGSPKTLRESIDSLLKTMFAPCTGDIGGIPRSDAFDSRPPSPRKIARKQSKQSSDTPSTVPFEVSASSSSLSQKGGSPAPFQKESLTKLRQLGAQHQLASGWHDESLADVARPSSPDKTDTPDLIDFDDGISAISSHTLEEMERRRQKDTVVPVVATALKEILNSPIKEDVEWKQKEFTEFPSFVADESNLYDIVKISRNESINTRKTNATEESFQKFMAQEAEYWEGEVKQDRRRTVERPSIEDRARRLRELSRSRSRSDGSSSKSKSLRAGSHPHDTVPVFSSDLFGKTKSSKSTASSSSRSKNFVPGSFDNSDPFAALDYGEI